MLVHGDYETYKLEFYIITTLDPHHPAHQVLYNFIKDCMCDWKDIKHLSESHLNSAKSIYFQTAALKSRKMLNKIWYIARVVPQGLNISLFSKAEPEMS